MPSRKGHPVARNNAILNNSPAFRNSGGYAPAPEYNQAPGAQQQWGQPQQQAPGYQAPQSQQAGYSPADLEAMYNRPAATGFDTGRMTWRNTMNAITATFGVIIAVAFVIMMLPTGGRPPDRLRFRVDRRDRWRYRKLRDRSRERVQEDAEHVGHPRLRGV